MSSGTFAHPQVSGPLFAMDLHTLLAYCLWFWASFAETPPLLVEALCATAVLLSAALSINEIQSRSVTAPMSLDRKNVLSSK